MHESRPRLQSVAEVRLPSRQDVGVGGCPRMVVVVEDATDSAWLARRTLELAQRRSAGILLLGIAPNPDTAAELRRQLVSVAAFIWQELERMDLSGALGMSLRAPEVRIEFGRDWLRGVMAQLRPGDTLACCSGQTVGARGRPLNDVLASSLDAPVYTFADPDSPRSDPKQALLSQLAAWVFSVLSIGGFLALQTLVVTQVQGWAQSALLLITVGMEVASIWLVNSLFGTF